MKFKDYIDFLVVFMYFDISVIENFNYLFLLGMYVRNDFFII